MYNEIFKTAGGRRGGTTIVAPLYRPPVEVLVCSNLDPHHKEVRYCGNRQPKAKWVSGRRFLNSSYDACKGT
jgi:hypothetical protein